MSDKLYIQTFGCQMNEYDSARMRDALEASHGLEITENPEDADVLLLNTCSIREKAQEKVFSQLGLWRVLKQRRPEVIIGVGGCVASQEGEALQRRAPYVDLVFGPQTLHRLPEMLDAARASRRPQVDISFPEIEKFDRLPEPRAEGPKAYVSAMEGCSKYCTFCVVPYTRGEEVSRPLADVLEEVQVLARQGVREVTLLGQNVNAYRGHMGDGEEADLALLLDCAAEIDGIGRLRFTTSHPIEMTDRLIATFGHNHKLAAHLHLPVQSGSDRVLAAMKRGHNRAEYLRIIDQLRAARPGISISSDFIVGFPGETEDDFEATLQLIDAVGFDHSYSFVYSPRPGTPAAEYVDDISEARKRARLAELQARLKAQVECHSAALVGTTQRVLVEGASKKNPAQLSGRTEHNRAVHFDAHPRLVGQFVDVFVTEAMPNSLRGRVTHPGSVISAQVSPAIAAH